MRELMDSYVSVVKDWYKIKGKLELRPYLLFVLSTLLIMTALIWLGKNVEALWFLFELFSLAMAVPFFTATIRRLHYVNAKGWYLFALLIPVIGLIWLCLYLFQENPDPRGSTTMFNNIKAAWTPEKRNKN